MSSRHVWHGSVRNANCAKDRRGLDAEGVMDCAEGMDCAASMECAEDRDCAVVVQRSEAAQRIRTAQETWGIWTA